MSTQQMRSIYAYIISLLLSTGIIQAQVNQKPEPARTPFFNGFTIHGDVASLAMPLVTNGVNYGAEGGIQVDIKQKLYPVFEMGFEGADKTTADNVRFTDYGVYTRFGVDFNIAKKGKDSKPTNNLFLAGARLGISNSMYNIRNITIQDDYWGGTKTLNYLNNPDTKVWFEIVASIRVEIIKNIYMGWNVRNKHMLKQDKEGDVSAWHVPGFGKNGATAWGFNYVVGYHFNTIKPQKSKKNNNLNK